MNKYINVPSKGANSGNTGIPDYEIIPKNIIGVILTSMNKKFTEADMVDFEATLQLETTNIGKDRIYPIFRFKGMSDNSGDVVMNTSGYGDEAVVRDGKYVWTYDLANDTGLYRSSQLRKLCNNGKFRALFIDSDGTIFGTYDDDGNFFGIAQESVYVYPWKANDGSNPASFRIRLAGRDPKELNENRATHIPSFVVEDSVKGLLNLTLTATSEAALKATVIVETEGDKTNLFDLYETELETASLWSVKKVSDGSTVTISTVASNSIKKGYDITVTGLSSATNCIISLAEPRVLATAGVGGAPESGYEGIPTTVTISNA